MKQESRADRRFPPRLAPGPTRSFRQLPLLPCYMSQRLKCALVLYQPELNLYLAAKFACLHDNFVICPLASQVGREMSYEYRNISKRITQGPTTSVFIQNSNRITVHNGSIMSSPGCGGLGWTSNVPYSETRPYNSDLPSVERQQFSLLLIRKKIQVQSCKSAIMVWMEL